MTDQERIKRLAEWMGWHYFSGWWCKGVDSPIIDGELIMEIQDWNPLERRQDAWILEEKLLSLGYDVALYQSKKHALCAISKNVFIAGSGECKKASEAICEAVEELMEESHGRRPI